MSAKLYIGTSGWAYKEWGKTFFPREVPQRKHLEYLATQFNTVEVNASFYRLQTPKTFEKWYSDTPDNFVFALKVSRNITHINRFKDVDDYWKGYVDNSKPLKQKRGPFLFQFPHFYHCNEEQRSDMEAFLKKFDPAKHGMRFAFEFRHAKCFSPETMQILEEAGAGLVFADSSKYPTAPRITPADFVYFRLHGPREMFASAYSKGELGPYANQIRDYLEQEKDVYAYFNNDVHSYAPENARELRELVENK